MNKQITLSVLTDELGQTSTRKKEFLQQIDRMVPWGEWEGIIRPYYYKGERGNKPYDLEQMMRIHLVQNLYSLSDMGTMTEVIDSRAFSEFCGVDSSNQVPDGDTIGRFRALLVEHGLQEKLFQQVVGLLSAQGLILKKGTIVDSTIIAAPSSTKNREGKRDPEACQTQKGNEWHFGYKAHIGVDKKTGLVHHVVVTSANVHDVTVTPRLLTGEETEVYGDSGFLGAEKREDAVRRNRQGKRIRYKINRRRTQAQKHQGRSGSQIKRREHEKSSVRAKVEHGVASLHFRQEGITLPCFCFRLHFVTYQCEGNEERFARKHSRNRALSAGARYALVAMAFLIGNTAFWFLAWGSPPSWQSLGSRIFLQKVCSESVWPQITGGTGERGGKRWLTQLQALI